MFTGILVRLSVRCIKKIQKHAKIMKIAKFLWVVDLDIERTFERRIVKSCFAQFSVDRCGSLSGNLRVVGRVKGLDFGSMKAKPG